MIVSLRTLTAGLIALIAANGIVVISGAALLANLVAQSQEEWRGYRDTSSGRAIALIDMGNHLGFNGVVHHLKNLVLRGDATYLDDLRASAGGVRSAIERYRTVGPDAAEEAALDTIETTLQRFERDAGAAISLRRSGVPVPVIESTIAFDNRPTLDALSILDASVAMRRASRNAAPTKLEALYHLRRSLGFGGMIDNFKNFVLLQDRYLEGETRQSIAHAKEAVAAYRRLEITDSEDAALTAIEAMVSAYEAKTTLVSHMAYDGTTAEAIDAKVRVDDRPAVSGLRELELAVAREAAARTQRIDSALDFVAGLSRARIFINILATLSAGGIVAWILLRAVQAPLARITRAMMLVAEGKTGGSIETKSRVKEVVALGEILDVFNTHAEELALNATSLHQFQQVSTDVGLNLDQRVERILRFGLERFGMEQGAVSRTTDNNYVVENSVGGAGERPRGTRFDLDVTYCFHTLQAGRARAYHNVAESELADQSCFKKFGLHAYIGAPVFVNGAVYGTVNFSAHEPRDRPFSDGDLAYVELIARWLGMELEREITLENLAKATAQAEEAARAKAQFLANMSHEIRTPMNGVIGLSGLALRSQLPEHARDYLEKINRSSLILLRIIDDILDFSKIEAGQMSIESTDFDLDDVLQNVATLVADRPGANPVEVIFSTDPAIPRTLVGDWHRIGQVLLNLIGNALKFTAAGEILVRISEAERSGDQLRLRIAVTDTGIGMNDEQMARLFKAFSQADGSTTRRFGGTGLGLAICKQLVGLMGGEISVTSVPGAGSTFTFTILVGTRESAGRRELARPIDPTRIRTLIVEDNAVARAVLADTLKGLRFTDVVTAADGAAGLEAFNQARARGTPFDLILVDWKMPGLDGMETARRMTDLSAPEARPKILMLTAHSRAELLDQAQAAGVLKVLVKPVNVSMLVDGIADALDTGSQAGAKTDAGREPDPLHRPRLRGVRVLLVEDNEINQQIAQEVLEGAGLTVAIAGNGNIALTALRDDGPLPDAILMDLQMPEIDGYETTRWIRADDRLQGIPVIAMTAHVTDDERQRCLAAGMVDHVSKPVDVRQLLDTLERWVGTSEDPASRDAGLPKPADPAVVAAPAVQDAVPALDLEGASKRMGLPMAALARAAAQFADSYRDAPAALTDLLDREQWKDAARFVHTIAGLAGTIGAPTLAAEAKVIEDALRNRESPVRPDLQALTTAHAAVFATLDRRAPAPRPAEPAAVKPAPDRGRLTDLVREMDQGLATNRMSVRRLLDELRALCDQEPAGDFEQLTTDLGTLNYPAARKALHAIATAHQIELGAENV